MASLARRLADLEGLYSAGSGNLVGPEGWREVMSASLERAEQRATDEEAQRDLRRRVALDKLYKFMERRPDGA